MGDFFLFFFLLNDIDTSSLFAFKEPVVFSPSVVLFILSSFILVHITSSDEVTIHLIRLRDWNPPCNHGRSTSIGAKEGEFGH